MQVTLFIFPKLLNSSIIYWGLFPLFLADLNLLKKGLKKLTLSDPGVETRVQEDGEHVLIATGELHLEVKLF